MVESPSSVLLRAVNPLEDVELIFGFFRGEPKENRKENRSRFENYRRQRL